MAQIRGKNLKSTAHDISEGYLIVNPLVLKSLDEETLKELNYELKKMQTAIRSEKFPHGDIDAIRVRNLRLQRLHSAAMILRNYARSKKIIII